MEHAPTYRRIRRTLWQYVLSFLETMFFSETLKLVALRLLLLGALVNLYIQIQSVATKPDYKYANIVIPGLLFICVHHITSAFKTRFIPRVLDFFVVVSQLILFILPNTSPLIVIYSGQNGFDTVLGVMSTMTLIGVSVFLIFLLVCRLASIIRHKGRNLLTPFDLLEDRPQARVKDLPSGSLLAGLALLGGRSLWRNHFLGERSYIRVIRGIWAACLVVAIMIYGLMAIAVQPALESAFIPIKQTRTSRYNSNNMASQTMDSWDSVFQNAAWNLYFAPVYTDSFNASVVELRDVVNVTTYSRRRGQAPKALSCSIESVNNALPNPTVKTNCPSYTNGNSNWDFHDLVISIDFTNMDFGIMGSNAIAVYPSLTDDFDLMLRDTIPFPLTRGVNYFATISVRGRRAYSGRNQVTSALGLFDSPKAYLVPTIEYVVADPLALRPPGVSTNVSYLRLTPTFDSSEFRIEADERDNTILSGFATVGGLFTFISGVFALIFGTTFLRILFDIKALSIFGIAQKWDRTRIVKAYLDAYPLLRAELEQNVSRRGVVAVMQDHVLDMELFKEVLEAEQHSSSVELIPKPHDEEQRTGSKQDLGGDSPEGEEVPILKAF